MSGQDCSYVSRALPENLFASVPPRRERSICPEGNESQGGTTLTTFCSVAATSLSTSNSSEGSVTNSQHDPTLDEAINSNHMELLIHLTFDKEIFDLGGGVDAYPQGLSLALKRSLQSPYLLHQLLAFSARHLAFLHSKRRAFYLRQAVTLQTRAVSLFNAAWTNVSQSNCVAVLLFSTILAHHVLADTLVERGPGGLEAFMAHYMHCLDMHRGIYTVASTAWPLLMESELEPLLSWSSEFTSRPPRGNHCQGIREMVDGIDRLGDRDKAACRLAIQYLQVGFDAVLTEEEQQYHRYQMIFSWTMLVPPEFVALLAAKRPEALVLLGYYALLLHHGRHLWQVRDAGAYILSIIVDYIDPEWDHWLEYPQKIVAEELG